MQLVLVAHRCRAALEVAHIGIIVGDDERALELSRLRRVDAEIARQLHRATYPLGDIDKRAVAEHRRVESGEEIVGGRHHLAQVFPHQVGIVAHGLADGAENHAQLGETLAIGGAHTHAVDNGIHRHAAQCLALLKGYAQFVEGLHQFWIHLALFLLLGSGKVADVLVVDFGQVHVPPGGLAQRFPVCKRLQTELQQPLRLMLEGRNLAHHILVESFGNHIRVDVGHKAIFIFLAYRIAQNVFVLRLLFQFLFLVILLVLHYRVGLIRLIGVDCRR